MRQRLIVFKFRKLKLKSIICILITLLCMTNINVNAQNSTINTEWFSKARMSAKAKINADSLHNLATIAIESYQFEKAIQLDLMAESVYVELSKDNNDPVLSSYGSGCVGCWTNLSLCYYILKDYSKSIFYNNKLLDYYKNHIGSAYEYIDVLMKTGYAYEGLRKSKEAIKSYHEAYLLLKQTGTDDYNLLSPKLMLLMARNYTNIEEQDSALYLGDKALNIYEALYQQGAVADSIYADALFEVSTLYGSFGIFQESISLSNKSLELIEKYKGRNNDYYAERLLFQCTDLVQNGQYMSAVDKLKWLLSYYESTKSRESSWNVKKGLCQIYLQIGDLKKALELSNQLLEEIKAFSPNSLDYESQLGEEALIYEEIGDYNHAITLEEDVLALSRNRNDSHSIATDMSILLNMYNNKALELFELNGDISGFEKNIGKGEEYLNYLSNQDFSSLRATFLDALCWDYLMLGDNYKALHCALESNEILKHTTSITDNRYITSLKWIKDCYIELTEYDRALDYALKISNIYRDSVGITNVDYPNSLLAVSLVYALTGNKIKALDFAKDAYNVCCNNDKEQNPYYDEILNNLISNYSSNGQNYEAFEGSKKLLNHEKQKVLELFEDINSSSRSAYWNKVSNDFLLFFPNYAIKSGNDESNSLIYDYSALFGKGMLLETDKATLQIIAQSQDTTAYTIFNNLCAYKDRLLHAINNGEVGTIKELRHNIFDLEVKLHNHVKPLGDITRRLQYTWHDVQNSLTDKDIAIEFLNFETDNGEDEYVALSLTKEDLQPSLTHICYRSQLDSILNYGLKDKIELQELSKLIWNPLTDKIKEKKNVYFAPSGILNNLGIEYASDLENYNVNRISSTRELVNDTDIQSTNNVVLYGGLTYEISSTEIEKASKRHLQDDLDKDTNVYNSRSLSEGFRKALSTFSFLPYTKLEVDGISDLLEKYNIENKVLEGQNGTEESFKSLSGHSPKILHFATHGFYLSESKARNKNNLLFLRNMNDNFSTYVTAENTILSRSGLILSGANLSLQNQDASNNIEDGILTSQEIADMNLHGLDLVVLSACQTGLGDIVQGEGVFGLQRGFKKAGAKTILMSLWKIDDRATQILMNKFYENLVNGMTKRESLKSAQQYLRNYENGIYEDPFYWGSFIMLD